MEPAQTTFQFNWGSAFGVSVIIFLFMNFIYLIVGVLTPIFFHNFPNVLSEKFGLGFSPGSDVVAFGKSTTEAIKDDPRALIIKTTFYDMLAGLYLAYAVLHFCMVYFGLMRGHTWALWALSFSNLAIIALFLVAARNFSVNLAPLKFSDLMPFATIPGILAPIASILGFIGMYFK